jgi:hypothetical protein
MALGWHSIRARHRGRIAHTLDSTEQQLWPEIPQPAITDSLAAYTDPDDPGAPTVETLIAAATKRIDVLDPTLESSDLLELLLAKADQGCEVRILATCPDPSFGHLLGHPQIEIRLIPAPADPVIHRVDDDVLVTLSLRSEHDQPPRSCTCAHSGRPDYSAGSQIISRPPGSAPTKPS